MPHSAYLSIIIVAPLLLFWAWMLHDMLRDDTLPDSSVPLLTWPPRSRFSWIVVFVVLNIFGAVFYYILCYRQKQ